MAKPPVSDPLKRAVFGGKKVFDPAQLAEFPNSPIVIGGIDNFIELPEHLKIALRGGKGMRMWTLKPVPRVVRGHAVVSFASLYPDAAAAENALGKLLLDRRLATCTADYSGLRCSALRLTRTGGMMTYKIFNTFEWLIGRLPHSFTWADYMTAMKGYDTTKYQRYAKAASTLYLHVVSESLELVENRFQPENPTFRRTGTYFNANIL